MTDSTMTQPSMTSASQEFSWKWFLFSAQGRVSRSDFWLKYFLPSIVLYPVIFIVLVIVLTGLDILASSQASSVEAGVHLIIGGLLGIITSTLVNIKRWHDRNKSGWWTLIILVPIIGPIWALIECDFLKGTAGPNRFDPSHFPEEQNING